MDFKSIQELLRFLNKSDLTEVEIQEKDFKIRVVRKTAEIVYSQAPMVQPVQMPVVQPIAQPVAPAAESRPAAEKPAAGNENLHTFRSPMIGTFYRSSSPDKPVFVNVGDTVKPGQVLCIIEAMKLFNEIECDVAGKIVKVLVDNAQPVEYEQPLFLIDTNA